MTLDYLEYSSDGSLEELAEAEEYVLISQNAQTPQHKEGRFKIKEKERKREARKSEQIQKALI
jgi:hypothetical protein